MVGWPTDPVPATSTSSSYSARKWARLALAGNPTVLLVLFVPEVEVVYPQRGRRRRLVANAPPAFVSKQAAQRFLGYLQAQRPAIPLPRRATKPDRTLRLSSSRFDRYDARYAMHVLRSAI